MSALKLYEHSESKNPKYLVILLHGYGANGENLINLAHELKHALPDAHFIAPNAVEPWEGGFPDAYQWFSLASGFERKSLEEMADNIKNANKIVTNLIDEQLQRFNLDYDKLFIVGFSQGAMLSIYQGLTNEKEPAGIISFSGKVILPEMLGEKIVTKPEICLIHGSLDSVVPFSSLAESQAILTKLGVKHQAHAIDDLEHAINLNAIDAAQEFIKNQIN